MDATWTPIWISAGSLLVAVVGAVFAILAFSRGRTTRPRWAVENVVSKGDSTPQVLSFYLVNRGTGPGFEVTVTFHQTHMHTRAAIPRWDPFLRNPYELTLDGENTVLVVYRLGGNPERQRATRFYFEKQGPRTYWSRRRIRTDWEVRTGWPRRRVRTDWSVLGDDTSTLVDDPGRYDPPQIY